MKLLLILAALAIPLAAHAESDNAWWVADQGGECHSLKAMFPGTQTPEEVHAVLTKRGGGPAIKRLSPSVTVFEDPLGNYPDLIMAKGWNRCLRIERSFAEQRSLKVSPE